jgi:hypothetical protein
MPSPEQAAQILTQAVDDLEEPYRGNTVRWLEGCMQHPVASLEEDLRVFLDDLHPVVRDSFVQHARNLLDDALCYFGREGGRAAGIRPRRLTPLSRLLAL